MVTFLFLSFQPCFVRPFLPSFPPFFSIFFCREDGHFYRKVSFLFFFTLRAVESISSKLGPTRVQLGWLSIFFFCKCVGCFQSPPQTPALSGTALYLSEVLQSSPDGSRRVLAVAPPPSLWPSPVSSLRPLLSCVSQKTRRRLTAGVV